MKKVIMAVVASACVVVCSVSVAAYTDEYPADAPLSGGAYLEVQCSPLGRALIYIPINYKDFYLTTVNGGSNIVNISNSTITGEIYYGNSFYEHTQFRLTRLSTGEYYYNYSANNWRWEPVSVTAIYNTNMRLADQSSEPVMLYDVYHISALIIIFLLGGILLCLFMRKSRG